MSDILSEIGTGRLTRGLRERLQNMTAAAQALSSVMAGNERAEEYLAVLMKEICGLLRLTRQTELHERLSSPDEIRLERTLVDLVALCQDVMKKVDSLTRKYLDIKAVFSTQLVALPTLADKGALEEMLLIFVSNAVRSIGRSGVIRLELLQEGERAVFIITDTGGGIDPDALPGPSEPEDEPQNEPQDGLQDESQEEQEIPARGLVLARQIAELHGGTPPFATNTESPGARLMVSIPIVEWKDDLLLRSPIFVDRGGGWDPALVALSDFLPAQAFLPDRRNK